MSKKSKHHNDNDDKPETIEIIHELDVEDKLSEAIYRFNVHPKSGILQLCDFYNVPNTPEEIAHILHTTEGLISEKIGEYLSDEKSEPILFAYFQELNLQMPFIKAIRKSLSCSLKLPGEAEQIDRIVHGFAKVYHQMNPTVFKNSDVAYILAFALILLNSDQHNPNMTHKMSSRDFIDNVRGALKPEDVSDSKLLSMYEDIKQNPLQFGETVDGGSEFLALSAPKLHGYLKKKTNKWNSIWKTHFFVLANSCLYYFKSDDPENKDDPIGMIQLVSVKVSIADKNSNRIVISAISSPNQMCTSVSSSNITLKNSHRSRSRVRASSSDIPVENSSKSLSYRHSFDEQNHNNENNNDNNNNNNHGHRHNYIQYVRFVRKKPEIVHGVSEFFLEAASAHIAERWYYRLNHSIVCANFGNECEAEEGPEMLKSFNPSAIGNPISETSDHTE
ncbi:hypothetical protein M9Y10_044137 [Tritrichomonas musculus]|uniref:Uncharacterized protein n=1 Tax=Tritrichomonas musculus TaxID=1915356 RepID=A0ABR2K1Q6_9EUKA